MLDLTRQIERPFEIKLLNGDMLRLHKPSQKLLLNLSKVVNETDTEIVVEALIQAFVDVMNGNMEGKVYTKEDFENYSLDLVSMVLNEYFNSVQDDLKK